MLEFRRAYSALINPASLKNRSSRKTGESRNSVHGISGGFYRVAFMHRRWNQASKPHVFKPQTNGGGRCDTDYSENNVDPNLSCLIYRNGYLSDSVASGDLSSLSCSAFFSTSPSLTELPPSSIFVSSKSMLGRGGSCGASGIASSPVGFFG